MNSSEPHLPSVESPEWAKIAGRKRERIVAIKLIAQASAPASDLAVERVVTTGQYL
jgi:hypothetical protein